MAYTFGHHKALLRRKINNAIFKIDQEMSVQNEKEFIDVFVLVPVIFALNHGQSDDRIVHLAKRLVVPLIRAGIGQFLHIDQFKRSVQNVEKGLVRKISRRFVGIHDLTLNARARADRKITYSSPSK